MAEDYKLIDNEEKHRYEFQIDGKIAEIDYIKSNALADIERQGLRLVPLCPFVAGYIHKHPEWKRIVMRGIHIK